jgi:hypothetical protein
LVLARPELLLLFRHGQHAKRLLMRGRPSFPNLRLCLGPSTKPPTSHHLSLHVNSPTHCISDHLSQMQMLSCPVSALFSSALLTCNCRDTMPCYHLALALTLTHSTALPSMPDGLSDAVTCLIFHSHYITLAIHRCSTQL